MVNFIRAVTSFLFCILISFFKITYAQIDQVDVNSKEYVEWVGSCETAEIEKAIKEGLGALSSVEKIKYYIDTRRCKYKNQSKIVHSQVDKKQLKEDSIRSSKFSGKASSITYCAGSLLIYLTLTNGQKF